MNALIPVLTIISILGAGLIAGTFFAFSTFIMPALASRPVNEAVPAMQEISIVVVRSLFIAVFFGTAVTSLALIVLAAIDYRGTSSALVIAGAAAYFAGSFLVTIFFNVPWNNSLAGIEPNGENAGGIWDRYVKSWTRWNHVRTIASAAAMVLLSASLLEDLLR